MIVFVLAIICLAILIIMKLNDKNNKKISKKLKMWSNILLISVIAFIVCIVLNNFIIEKNAIFTTLLYIIGCIGIITLISCTVIGIKDKEKLPLWVSLIQGIVIVVIIGSIINTVINNNTKSEDEKNIKEYEQKMLNAINNYK